MTEQMRNDLTPQGYILRMYSETKNGEFKVEYRDPDRGFIEAERRVQVNWTKEDAEKTVQRYNLLTFALARIGRLHDQLDDEESRKRLLSEDDLAVWNTYIRPYEPMEVKNWDELYPILPCEQEELMSLIYSIHVRAQDSDLIEEEELLWKQYCMWEEEQSQKRIPFHRRSCVDLIIRARRYERLISMNAPEIVVTEEGRCLAEEMVRYYFGKEEPLVWE